MMSISLDPDQSGCFVNPNQGPNCLQKFLADDTGKVLTLKAPITTAADKFCDISPNFQQK